MRSEIANWWRSSLKYTMAFIAMRYMCAIIRTSKIRLLILGSYPVLCKHQLFGIT